MAAPSGADKHPSTLPHHQSPADSQRSFASAASTGVSGTGNTTAPAGDSFGSQASGAPSAVGGGRGGEGGDDRAPPRCSGASVAPPALSAGGDCSGGAFASGAEPVGDLYRTSGRSRDVADSGRRGRCAPCSWNGNLAGESFDGRNNNCAAAAAAVEQRQVQYRQAMEATLSSRPSWPYPPHAYFPAARTPYDPAPFYPVVGPSVTPSAGLPAVCSSHCDGPMPSFFHGGGSTVGGWGSRSGGGGDCFPPPLPLPRPAFGGGGNVVQQARAYAPAQHLATLRDLLAAGGGGDDGEEHGDGDVVDGSDCSDDDGGDGSHGGIGGPGVLQDGTSAQGEVVLP